MSSSRSNEAEVLGASVDVYAVAHGLERRQGWNVYPFVKRSMDIILSFIGIIVLCPVFLLVILLIKLEDPKGSAIFYQVRIGKNERPFRMIKFRSMVSDAEARLSALLVENEIEGAMFKMRDDPRITRVGRFLRRTSIDELPQLFNVLRGQMSLVGPRPPLPREVHDYTVRDKLRLTVTPGCTGLWQISGRNHLSFNQMVELDLEYISRRSFRTDMIIMLKTFRVLLGSKDAY
ncbi:UDP-N-acetylgalactosamine-undecaprenyl-phosphate N-acetylgalactosaminephosphotransferase [Paenibacillus polymyxa E681]|uniref:sugar transferase n=1 Tax=Paenibacillus polymyxa TaxID=1406 RepID=UPI0001E312B1|nr:sugar transferase [Paenibacillus polymyxa]ADM68990.1 multidrug MFS transporter [Paenibacillus polymyxa E681]QNV55997.1 UDP-N-acetylgalactosamine-undecaprenyl-phosphate N-acetylgalactosaminephosphotransferase [Paenibacillus polymyxa E681]QNV60834.1 UDP-N-acetylgalactosamine-undecaprenyl-phosphate N-acetylgalactosaminephosphotransferase [Paenibacillus polymyxa E681]